MIPNANFSLTSATINPGSLVIVAVCQTASTVPATLGGSFVGATLTVIDLGVVAPSQGGANQGGSNGGIHVHPNLGFTMGTTYTFTITGPATATATGPGLPQIGNPMPMAQTILQGYSPGTFSITGATSTPGKLVIHATCLQNSARPTTPFTAGWSLYLSTP